VCVIWSFAHLAVRSLFAFGLLLGRSDRSNELEILVLRHELTVLRRGSHPPRIEPADRALLATLSRALPRSAWAAFSVRPETLLRCCAEISVTTASTGSFGVGENSRPNDPRRDGNKATERYLA
jgi:hypothetical protein